MEVGDYLTGMGPCVYHQAVATFGNPLRSGQLVGHMYHVPQQPLLLSVHLDKRWDMGFRNDKQVGWRLRSAVADGDDLIILVEDVALDFAGDNSAEDTVFGHLTPFLPLKDSPQGEGEI